jgi:hypothetical protein
MGLSNRRPGPEPENAKRVPVTFTTLHGGQAPACIHELTTRNLTVVDTAVDAVAIDRLEAQ